jgi:hypothetical protein
VCQTLGLIPWDRAAWVPGRLLRHLDHQATESLASSGSGRLRAPKNLDCGYTIVSFPSTIVEGSRGSGPISTVELSSASRLPAGSLFRIPHLMKIGFGTELSDRDRVESCRQI